MSKTKRVYLNTISTLLIMSLLFIENLSSEEQLASASVSNATATITNTSSGLGNATSATGALNATQTLAILNQTATEQVRLNEQVRENASQTLTSLNETAAVIAEQVRANLAMLNFAQQQQGFATTMVLSVAAIAGMVVAPLLLTTYLRYRQGVQTSSKGTNILPLSMNQLYRMLVAIGVIFVVVLIVVYLNSLIWFNTAQGPEPVVTSLLETQKNFLTIIGTAFASLVAFYFGTRGTQDRNAERTTSITGRETAQKTLEVIGINPIDGTVGVEVDSPVTATFSTSIRSSTINANTFSVKDANGNPVQGRITLTDNNTTIRFNPVPPLNRNSRYTVTITKGIMDISGASLAADMEWHFTTG